MKIAGLKTMLATIHTEDISDLAGSATDLWRIESGKSNEFETTATDSKLVVSTLLKEQGKTAIIATARAIGRGSDAHARSIANFIDRVEHVYAVEAHL